MPILEYTLLRSDRRKTLALQVKAGQVIVRAPHFVEQQVITDLIADKSEWLRKKISIQVKNQVDSCNFTHGSLIYFAGKAIPLHVIYDNKADVLFYEDELSVVISFRRKTQLDSQVYSEQALAKQVKKQLEQWFKYQCQLYIDATLPKLVKHTNLIPNSIKIRQYQARWGSCNSRKELSFNYLLMMAPHWVVDYVIIHELCHLQHLNHSARFWALVQLHSPHFLQAKQWLKTHQAQLKWQLPY